MICLPLLVWLILTGVSGVGKENTLSQDIPEGNRVRLEGTVYKTEDTDSGQRIFILHTSILSEASDHVEALSIGKNSKVLAYIIQQEPCKIGSRVQILGICAYPGAPENPGMFDEREYYASQGISMLVKKAVIEKTDGKEDLLRETLKKCRNCMKQILCRICPKEEYGILCAMILGDKGELDQEIKELYQAGGVLHMLAISGLHVSLLGAGLFGMLRKTGLSIPKGAVISGGVLILYGCMTGMSPSAVRAILMFLIFLGSQAAGRTYDSVTALLVSAVFALMKSPEQIAMSGFLLSYGAVAGTVISPVLLGKGRRGGNLKISFSVWMVTLPLVSRFYYRVPMYGILLNLIVLPLMPVIMISGMAGIAAGFLSAELGTFFAAPAYYGLKMVAFLCRIIKILPGCSWVTGRLSSMQIGIYYLIFLILLLCFAKKQKIGLIQRAFGIILIISIVCFQMPAKWTMTFLNVGQGDGICIRMPGGAVWMVDGGSSDREKLGEYSLSPYLEYQGIEIVDYWMVSHFDGDHISGLMEILETYHPGLHGSNSSGISIGCLVIPDLDETNEKKERLLELAGQNHIPVRKVSEGDEICQEETVCRVLAPSKVTSYGDENEASMVLEISYPGFRALLTGDMGEEGEQKLLEKGLIRKTDVLKAGHHGSKMSTGEGLLQTASPTVAVISCGSGNRYGHPHEEVLDRLEEEEIRILRTDESGAIDIIVTEQGWVAAKA